MALGGGGGGGDVAVVCGISLVELSVFGAIVVVIGLGEGALSTVFESTP